MLMRQAQCVSGKGKQQAQTIRFSNKGFSLIELLFASMILTVTLVGLLALLIQCVFLNELNRNYVLVTKSLQSKMEEAKEAGFYNIFAVCPGVRPPGAICDGDTFDINGFQVGTAKGRIEISDIHTNLKQVRIMGSFRSRGRTVGGDVNFDGVVNGGESPGSPAELITLISLP